MLLASEERVEALGIPPRVRIVDTAVYSGDPEWYTTAPVGAIQKILKKNHLRTCDISRFEINEAFAVVACYAIRKLSLKRERVNVNGGAIAFGHPIGATGARLVANLFHELQSPKNKYGIAVACSGDGDAVAILLENTSA